MGEQAQGVAAPQEEVQGERVDEVQAVKRIERERNEDGYAAVEVFAQYHGDVVDNHVADDAATHGGGKAEHDDAEGVEAEAEADLRAGDGEGDESQGVRPYEEVVDDFFLAVLQFEEPGKRQGEGDGDECAVLGEDGGDTADQDVAHHAAANGGEQGDDEDAKEVEAFACADKVAGDGEGDGADDVDDVGGGHGGRAAVSGRGL